VLLSWRAARLAKEPGVAPGVAVDATELHHDLDRVAEELRRLVHGLMPALLTEQGLYAAVEDLLDDTPFRVTFAAGGSDRGLPTTVESTLYLVVAETLTNAVKYARAEHLCVDLSRRSDRMRVEIADDGVGGAYPRAGSGLSGMAERVDVLGGTFVLTSPPSGGTRLLVEVPCAP
jgi:signal transduction histidine kinase